MAPITRTRKKKRSMGFTQIEIDNMLGIIEKVLPVGGEEWKRVADLHLLIFPEQCRTKESIKRKYQGLYRKQMPSGDPYCPTDVRYAKQINEKVKRKMELSDGEGDESLNGDDSSEGTDNEQESGKNGDVAGKNTTTHEDMSDEDDCTGDEFIKNYQNTLEGELTIPSVENDASCSAGPSSSQSVTATQNSVSKSNIEFPKKRKASSLRQIRNVGQMRLKNSRKKRKMLMIYPLRISCK